MSRFPSDDNDLDDLSDGKRSARQPPLPNPTSGQPSVAPPVGPRVGPRVGPGRGPTAGQPVASPQPTGSTPAAPVLPAEPEIPKGWELLVGRTYVDLLTARLGKRGLIRRVKAGIEYVAPPLPFVWKENADVLQHYEMELPAQLLEQVGSLRSLHLIGQELAGHRPISHGAPWLVEFHTATEALLDTTATFHADGLYLGLISPRNVLWAKNDPETLLLPDIGFYRAEGSLAPETPAWLTDQHEFAALWQKSDGISAGPRELQHLRPAAGSFDPRLDIRTLARVFACVLTGQPESRIARKGADRKADVWRVLEKAERGEYPSLSAFREDLNRWPLTNHFEYPPDNLSPQPVIGLPGSRSKFPKILVLALGAVMVIGLGGLSVYLMRPDTPSVVKPPLGESEIPEWLASLQRELEDLKKGDGPRAGGINLYCRDLRILRDKIQEKVQADARPDTHPAVKALLDQIHQELLNTGRAMPTD